MPSILVQCSYPEKGLIIQDMNLQTLDGTSVRLEHHQFTHGAVIAAKKPKGHKQAKSACDDTDLVTNKKAHLSVGFDDKVST